jgi:mannose/cellobiose epimerase-like protein (N-acyl-D-glucosamine 2-epimerase family)
MKIDFSFSDMIAGYVTSHDAMTGWFSLETSDGRALTARLTASTFARFSYNLDEKYQGTTHLLASLLGVRPQFVFVYGTYYTGGHGIGDLTAQWIIFSSGVTGSLRHEEPDWWINQSGAIGNSYLKWQFDHPAHKIDYDNYRTNLNVAGAKDGGYLQETDTISRLVYGFATAYMLTGRDSFLEAAEKGTQYLHDHLRFHDTDSEVIYWYHGIAADGEKKHKLLTSEFGDDYHSLPIYEQIYALCGPVMTYRLTGNPGILDDIEKTLALFERFYKDERDGGYFSHLDEADLDGRAQSLGQNRARKNWNSIGDHAPAYLINLYLATGNPKYVASLEETFDLIVDHFPDFEASPFVQERFFEDWTPDQAWGWQQNCAVVGHNLKIAWNLMRMMSLKPKRQYVDLARKIAEVMPAAARDAQRGGWYDTLERQSSGDGYFRVAFHDRKAWWQQEQAILAYYILFGVLGEDQYLRLARESAAFYNAFFLDHEDGGVYFNVLANGLPYLLGNERLKGSHSMSAYHSMELCFLSAVYINLLVKKQPLALYFKPYPKSLPGDILRISPDLLPPGSIYIDKCWIDGQEYHDFDDENLTVHLPLSDRRMAVKVLVAPTSSLCRKNPKIYAN